MINVRFQVKFRAAGVTFRTVSGAYELKIDDGVLRVVKTKFSVPSETVAPLLNQHGIRLWAWLDGS